jgi:hypothetical protein
VPAGRHARPRLLCKLAERGSGNEAHCADSCAVTARTLSRHTGYDADLTRAHLEACVAACRACGDECQQHAGMHEHCAVCAEACRECESACRKLLSAIS